MTGPLTTSPREIVVEQPRATADVAITGDQAVLTAGRRRHGHPQVGLIFGSISVGWGIDLERRIRPPSEPEGSTPAASSPGDAAADSRG